MTGSLPDLKERGSVFLELPAGRRKLSTISISYEQLAAKRFFEGLDAGTDRGLRHVQAFGGFPETASTDDFEEGSRAIDIHLSHAFQEKILRQPSMLIHRLNQETWRMAIACILMVAPKRQKRTTPRHQSVSSHRHQKHEVSAGNCGQKSPSPAAHPDVGDDDIHGYVVLLGMNGLQFLRLESHTDCGCPSKLC